MDRENRGQVVRDGPPPKATANFGIVLAVAAFAVIALLVWHPWSRGVTAENQTTVIHTNGSSGVVSGGHGH